METKLIKTCSGLVELRFLDGALLPLDGDLSSAPSLEWTQEYLPLPRIPDEVIKELNAIMLRAYQRTFPPQPAAWYTPQHQTD